MGHVSNNDTGNNEEYYHRFVAKLADRRKKSRRNAFLLGVMNKHCRCSQYAGEVKVKRCFASHDAPGGSDTGKLAPRGFTFISALFQEDRLMPRSLPSELDTL